MISLNLLKFCDLLATATDPEFNIDDIYILLQDIYSLVFAIALLLCFLVLVRFINSFFGG